MTGLEDTMRSIRKEEAEIHLMRRSLDAGLAKAVLVLEETKSKYDIFTAYLSYRSQLLKVFSFCVRSRSR